MKLDPERAEALAAGLRPSWEPEPPPDADGATVRESLPSAEFLDSGQVIAAPATPIDAMPSQTLPLGSSRTALGLAPPASSPDLDKPRSSSMRPSAPDFTPRTPSAFPPPASSAAAVTRQGTGTAPLMNPVVKAASVPPPAAARAPSVRPARAEPSAVATSELAAIVPKSSNKGLLYGVVGVASLGLLLLLARAGASDDAPKSTAPVATALPARAADDIPPPPPKEELPTPAPVTPVVATAAAAPVPAPAPKPEPVAKHAETQTHAAAPKPIAKPAPVAKPTPVAKPAPAPKSAPKTTSGGIVRDTPF